MHQIRHTRLVLYTQIVPLISLIHSKTSNNTKDIWLFCSGSLAFNFILLYSKFDVLRCTPTIIFWKVKSGGKTKLACTAYLIINSCEGFCFVSFCFVFCFVLFCLFFCFVSFCCVCFCLCFVFNVGSSLSWCRKITLGWNWFYNRPTCHMTWILEKIRHLTIMHIDIH